MELNRRDIALCIGSAIVGGFLVKLLSRRAARRALASSNSSASNNASAGSNKSGANNANSNEALPSKMKATYETTGAVAQYLLFHFAPLSAYFKYNEKTTIEQAYGFPIRVAEICQKHKPANMKRALDLGCAVGASSFVLSRYFDKVVGVDLSEAFINAAKEMKEKGSMSYEVITQGSITEHHVARLGDVFPANDGFHPERVEFQVGDAENIQLGGFDFILACNLVCRVPHPRKLIQTLANHTNKGGVLVVLSPFSWTEESTNRSEWIGGSEAAGGRSEPIFKKLMVEAGYELLEEGYEPHLIPDHARRYQFGFPMKSVWRKK